MKPTFIILFVLLSLSLFVDARRKIRKNKIEKKRPTLEEQFKELFEKFDENKDGKLDEKELFTLLKVKMTEESFTDITDEQLSEQVNKILKQYSIENQDYITLNEFFKFGLDFLVDDEE